MVFLPNTPDFKLDCHCGFHEESQEFYKLKVKLWPVHRDLGTTFSNQSFKKYFLLQWEEEQKEEGRNPQPYGAVDISSHQVMMLIRALDRKLMIDFIFPRLGVCLTSLCWNSRLSFAPPSEVLLIVRKRCLGFREVAMSSSHYPDFLPIERMSSELKGLLYILPQCPHPPFFFRFNSRSDHKAGIGVESKYISAMEFHVI